MIKRIANQTWYLATTIPSIQPGNLLPVMLMILLWVVMTGQGVAESPAFVMSSVAAQACVVWRNLPRAAQSLNEAAVGRPRLVILPVALIIALAALQLWLMNPLFTQRFLSAYALFFLFVMLIGIAREDEMLSRVTPAETRMGRATMPVSLLRVNALTAAVVITANEALIAFETLSVWISIMPILLLVVHAFYWALVLSVLPSEEVYHPGQ